MFSLARFTLFSLSAALVLLQWGQAAVIPRDHVPIEARCVMAPTSTTIHAPTIADTWNRVNNVPNQPVVPETAPTAPAPPPVAPPPASPPAAAPASPPPAAKVGATWNQVTNSNPVNVPAP